MKMFLLIGLFITSLNMQAQSPNIITAGCEVVEKPFITKSGKESTIKELYLRCSVQDYFIKFCESKITRKKLEKHLGKSIVAVYEVKDGEWDICEEDQEMQSRVGTYAVLLDINPKKKKKH